MKKICLYNTAIASTNLGDYIIMDSVKNEIHQLLPNDFFVELATHEKLFKSSWNIIKKSDFGLIGGTNLLSSNMNKYNQWKINFIDSLYIKNTILMGVGWWQYQKKPNLYTKKLLQRVLHPQLLHSVRDNYTKRILNSIGIMNVLNTGCPTMWNLTEKHCKNIPATKAKHALFTLTDYNKNDKLDIQLIQTLLKSYTKVFFWPQGINDYKYISELELANKVIILNPNLISLDKILNNKKLDIDYIGTRLHAGIRSLQKSRRSIIIGIDNRAIEKSKDFNLTIIPRTKMELLEKKILAPFKTEIILPNQNIKKWKSQFIHYD